MAFTVKPNEHALFVGLPTADSLDEERLVDIAGAARAIEPSIRSIRFGLVEGVGLDAKLRPSRYRVQVAVDAPLTPDQIDAAMKAAASSITGIVPTITRIVRREVSTGFQSTRQAGSEAAAAAGAIVDEIDAALPGLGRGLKIGGVVLALALGLGLAYRLTRSA